MEGEILDSLAKVKNYHSCNRRALTPPSEARSSFRLGLPPHGAGWYDVAGKGSTAILFKGAVVEFLP